MGIMKSFLWGGILLLSISLTSGCQRKEASQQQTQQQKAQKTLKSYPIDDKEGIITQDKATIDRKVSADGKGSLKIQAGKKTVVELYEVTGLAVENAKLLYEAKVRLQDVQGPVYLEMWTVFKDKGKFFSRGLKAPLTGTTDWKTTSIPFYLKKGEKPDSFKLNLVIGGAGTVWIDGIRLLKEPLPSSGS